MWGEGDRRGVPGFRPLPGPTVAGSLYSPVCLVHAYPKMSHVIPLELFQVLKSDR